MPWLEQSPLSAGTNFVSAYLAAKQQAQAQADAAKAAAEKEAYDRAFNERKLTDEEGTAAANRAAAAAQRAADLKARGFDENGNPLPTTSAPSTLTQGRANATSGPDAAPLAQQLTHYNLLAKHYAGTGKPQDAKLAAYYASKAQDVQKQIDAQQQQAATLARQLKVRATPTYANLHPHPRTGGGPQPDANDYALYAQAAADIVNTPAGKNPMDTAATYSGKAASKAIKSEIESLGRQELVRRLQPGYIPPAKPVPGSSLPIMETNPGQP